MNILVTGANGFVGQALCDALRQRNHGVRAIVRRVRDDTRVTALGEIDEKTVWTTALLGIDVVIHLAARVHVMQDSAVDPIAEFSRINTAGTDNLARAAAASGVKRLVYVSSIKVNGEATVGAQKFTEADLPAPQDPYGISKFAAELALHRVAKETPLEIVVVRPALVYGAGVKGNFEHMLQVLMSRIPLPLAAIRNQRSMIYLGNLVDALMTCATHPNAAGNTYLVSDGEDIATPNLLRQLGAALGKSARLFPFPTTWLQVLAQRFGKGAQIARLTQSLKVDSGKIRRDLAWTPPFSLHEGLVITAQSYRK